MNNNGLYELGIALSGIGILILIPSLCICYNEFNNKQKLSYQYVYFFV